MARFAVSLTVSNIREADNRGQSGLAPVGLLLQPEVEQHDEEAQVEAEEDDGEGDSIELDHPLQLGILRLQAPRHLVPTNLPIELWACLLELFRPQCPPLVSQCRSVVMKGRVISLVNERTLTG